METGAEWYTREKRDSQFSCKYEFLSFYFVLIIKGLHTLVLVKKIEKFFIAFSESTYTRDSIQREARASECSLQRAREGTPPYPTCYARHMMRAVSDVM